jgi:hypothetical protein
MSKTLIFGSQSFVFFGAETLLENDDHQENESHDQDDVIGPVRFI